MELNKLRYVVAVAHTGNFFRAAEQCHVSQPSLSQQIQKLEEELGERLFDRMKREVKHTPHDEAFLHRAMNILEEVNAAKREATDAKDLLRGTVAVGVLPTIAPSCYRFCKTDTLFICRLRYSVVMESELAVKNGNGSSHRVEINVKNMVQLFNTMDPSPFKERDIDRDAEEFIVSWVREFPVADPVALVVYLKEYPADREPQPIIEQAMHHYFEERARINGLELRRLFKEGRQSLLIGLLFLAGCLALSNAIGGQTAGTVPALAHESLTIAGWVAMWKPMQVYLYDWWPLRRRGKIFEKLSRVPVEVRQQA